jgi:hypothetical protein
MSNYKKKPETVDLVKLTNQMVDDLRTFDQFLWNEIVYLYLHQAFTLGDKHGWWKEHEDLMIENEEDKFDEAFFGGDHEDKL